MYYRWLPCLCEVGMAVVPHLDLHNHTHLLTVQGYPTTLVACYCGRVDHLLWYAQVSLLWLVLCSGLLVVAVLSMGDSMVVVCTLWSPDSEGPLL